jgi:SAM-dependent methyltransferase
LNDRQRRALTHVGGEVTYRGRPALEALVRRALSVSNAEAEVREHVHGFHSYPARLHPRTAAALIDALSEPGETVFDPFCGSGTILVEAVLLARNALGADINPLSVELTKLKTRVPDAQERHLWLEAAESIAQFAEERRTSKASPIKRYAPRERAFFDVHMLLELDSLSAGVRELEHPKVQQALRLVLSSIVTKISKQPGDSARVLKSRRLAGGFAIRMFRERVEELCAQCEALESRVAKRMRTRITEADARELKGIKPNCADLIVCSPPYPGVYDYYDHHRLRMSFIGLKGERFRRDEIGSRRQFRALSGAEARHAWERDLQQVFIACGRVLRAHKYLCCVVADVALDNATLRGDDCVARVADLAGFQLAAVGSQRRPVFYRATETAYRGRERAEHLVILQR